MLLIFLILFGVCLALLVVLSRAGFVWTAWITAKILAVSTSFKGASRHCLTGVVDDTWLAAY